MGRMASCVAVEAGSEGQHAVNVGPTIAGPTTAGSQRLKPGSFHVKRKPLIIKKGILHQQVRKLDKDFTALSKAFRLVSREEYVYHWLIINTRSFYCVAPGIPSAAPDDCMALCPFVDYFNHADAGVNLALSQ